jgi:hypothetical protein
MQFKTNYYLNLRYAPLWCWLVIILSSINVSAQTTWNGGAGNWSNGSLWSTGTAPNSASANVDVDGGNPVASSVSVDGTFTVGQITIDAGDSVLIDDAENFTVTGSGGLGTIVNNGNLTINSTGDATDLSISGGITLSGSGVLTMAGNANILGSGDLVSSSVIQGTGNIGNSQIAMTNQGLINANVSGTDLVIDPANVANALINTGTMQASGGGILVLDGTAGGSIDNAGGIIQALNGSEVELDSASIAGGTLVSSGSGMFVATDSSNNYLNGVTVNGNLNLTGTGNAQVLNGLVLNGTTTIDGGFILSFQGTQALSGSATILFGPGPGNQLAIDSGSSATLTLASNVLVHGQNGSIGGTAFSSSATKLINNGTIAADVAGGTITLQTTSGDPDSVANAGTLEAINGGTLAIDSNVSNTGLIQSGNGVGASTLNLNNAGITQSGTGSIIVSSSGGLTFNNSQVSGGTLTSAVPVFFTTSGGNVLASVNATLAGINLGSTGIVRILDGGLTLNGTANINGGGVFGFQETQTLNGSATILFGSSAFNRLAIDSASTATLTFGPTVFVHGTNGTIGLPSFIGGTTKLINDGVISADGAFGTISLNTTSTAPDSVANSGTLEGINQGTLAIDSNVSNAAVLEALNGGALALNANITNTGSGNIDVSGAGTIIAQNGITITGGVINQSAPGSFNVAQNGNNFLNGVTVNGNLNLTAVGEERVLNGLVLNGTASIDNGGVLAFQETQMLSGSATILFGSSTSNRLGIDSASTATLTLGSNVFVHGQNGTIGDPVFVGGTTLLSNNGTIAADVAGGTITLQASSNAANSLANSGTMEAINGGTLTINSNLTNAGAVEALNGGTLISNANITNTGGGNIDISGAGSGFDQSGISIAGGVINQSTSGNFVVAQNGSNFLSGVTVNGNLNLSAAGDERVLNGLVLNGTASIDSGGVLAFQETQMLSGSGTILFGSTNSNRLGIDSASTATLTLGPNVFVHGQNGTIGQPVFIGGTTLLTNNGTISADAAGGTITVEPTSGAAGSVTNGGTLEAANGGTLTIDSNLTNTGTLEAINGGTVIPNTSIINTGGNIDVSGAGSSIGQSNISITGGVINQSASGSFNVAQNGNNFLNGVTVNGNLNLTAGGYERVLNGLVLNGTASIDAGGVLAFQETQMLSGSATILFGSSTINRLAIDSGSSATLTLGPNVYVHGQNGTIGNTAFVGGVNKLINNGTISADAPGGTIILDTTSTDPDSVANGGTLEAANGGTLSIVVNVTNSGTFEALDASNLTMQTDVLLANDSAGVLSGGAYGAVSTGDGATVTLSGSAVSQIAANTEVELSGSGSVVQFNGTPVETTLVTNDGTLAILGNRNYTNVNSLENGGIIQLGGGNFIAPSLTNDASGLIHGAGALSVSGAPQLINNGTISADVAGGTLTIDSNISNAGLIQAGSGAGVASLSLNNVTITQSGTGAITISPSGGLSVTDSEIVGGALTSAGSCALFKRQWKHSFFRQCNAGGNESWRGWSGTGSEWKSDT